MAGRIGFERAATRRGGTREASRYVAPRSAHAGALWLATAAPLLAILLLLGARAG
ncbi:hypothetical protein [uncultured Methylobacterium sp.]|uniref:hypothetical protein n=1 Tax=uncultured Methylobacterium sp. TaxID=157278 RepID=UPI0035CA8D0B